jgi:lipopolysaccharide/colanic/teichoic acid biosynthesis glycosyltransferase
MYILIIKPVLDFLLAIVGLVLSLPFFLILSVLIPIFIGGNPLYKTTRGGKGGRQFSMYKFRSMNDRKDEHGVLLPDSERLTKFGSFIRKMSIDELPQFINILKGDMSFIGPRPLFADFIPLYNQHQMRRHEVKPGITGWAQTHGRNTISWNKKFELDIWYVDHVSFMIDLKITYLTCLRILRFSEVNQKGHVSSEMFLGDN